MITTVVVHRSTRRFVEDAIGEQMVMQARIVAHLVAIAQQENSTGMTAEAINEHFKQITRFAKEYGNYDYEFWVTDSSGTVRLGSQGVEFTFTPDQPQAGTFLRLLEGHSNHTDVVVQESRRREVDPSVFKFVGVSGVDMPRIVQVGYRTDSLLADLAWKNSLLAAGIAGLLLATGILGYFILRRMLTVPLDKLVRAARAAENEEYKVGALEDLVSRGDELGRLASVFEGMVVKLATRYEELVNFMRSAVIKVRGDGVITFANTHAGELFGFTRAELVGTHLKLIFPPERHGEIQERIDSIKGQEVRVNEVRQNVTKSGKSIWVAWSNRLIKSGAGTEKELLFVGNDVTEEVRQKNELLIQHSALEAAANAITIVDRKGDIQWVNRAFTRLTGFTPEEAAGQNPRVLNSGVHPKEFYRNMWQTVLGGSVWQGTLTNKRKDGVLYQEEMTITPVRSRDGDITHFVAVKQDITERLEADQRLRDTEQFFRSVLELAPDGLMVADADGKIQLANAQCEKLFGYNREELIGQQVEMLVPADVRSGHPAKRDAFHEESGLTPDGLRARTARSAQGWQRVPGGSWFESDTGPRRAWSGAGRRVDPRHHRT